MTVSPCFCWHTINASSLFFVYIVGVRLAPRTSMLYTHIEMLYCCTMYHPFTDRAVPLSLNRSFLSRMTTCRPVRTLHEAPSGSNSEDIALSNTWCGSKSIVCTTVLFPGLLHLRQIPCMVPSTPHLLHVLWSLHARIRVFVPYAHVCCMYMYVLDICVRMFCDLSL